MFLSHHISHCTVRKCLMSKKKRRHPQAVGRMRVWRQPSFDVIWYCCSMAAMEAPSWTACGWDTACTLDCGAGPSSSIHHVSLRCLEGFEDVSERFVYPDPHRRHSDRGLCVGQVLNLSSRPALRTSSSHEKHCVREGAHTLHWMKKVFLMMRWHCSFEASLRFLSEDSWDLQIATGLLSWS